MSQTDYTIFDHESRLEFTETVGMLRSGSEPLYLLSDDRGQEIPDSVVKQGGLLQINQVAGVCQDF